MISVVSPVYRSEKILPELLKRLEQALTAIGEDFEVVLIEDRGPDQSWPEIQRLAKQYKFLRGFRLSRNFGQHAAISAGIAKAKGDKIVVMDCDLQDDPIFIAKLLDVHRQGADIVYTYKRVRKHAFLKNLFAGIWHKVFNWLSEGGSMSSDQRVGSFSLISRKVADAYLNIGESRRHYLLILRWLGFSSATIEIEHRERFEGRSSYTFRKLVQHAVTGILSQSNRLLYLSIGLGLSFVALSMLGTIVLIVAYFAHGFLQGWASQMVMLVLCTGIILVMLGVIGAYLGMVLEQVKQRPLFLIDETTESSPR